jgi:hypothetical protein
VLRQTRRLIPRFLGAWVVPQPRRHALERGDDAPTWAAIKALRAARVFTTHVNREEDDAEDSIHSRCEPVPDDLRRPSAAPSLVSLLRQ